MTKTAPMAAILAAILLSGCQLNPAPAISTAERKEREAALLNRQLELLQLREEQLIALYGEPSERDLNAQTGVPLLVWSRGNRCDLVIETDAFGQAVAASFRENGDETAIRDCDIWLGTP